MSEVDLLVLELFARTSNILVMLGLCIQWFGIGRSDAAWTLFPHPEDNNASDATLSIGVQVSAIEIEHMTLNGGQLMDG